MSEDFYGYPTRTLANEHIRLDYLTTAGPRIVRLSLVGSSDNLLAEVADITIPTSYGDFHLYGGHRLWHSPEAMPRSYMPDNDAPEIVDLPDGVRLTQAVEPATGIRKSIELRLEPGRPGVTVTHRLENQGTWPVELAPWAITQMRLGGLAVFPQTQGNLDGVGLLANRNLVLWPYTRLADPRLSLNDDYAFISADAIFRRSRSAISIVTAGRATWWPASSLSSVSIHSRPCRTPISAATSRVTATTVSSRSRPSARCTSWRSARQSPMSSVGSCMPRPAVPPTPAGLRDLIVALGL